MALSAFLAFLISFGFTVLGIPNFIRFMASRKIDGQQMQEEVEQHADKAGTPTMGGLVFIIVALVVSFVLMWTFTSVRSNFLIAWGVLAAYALVGFVDDFLKLFRKQNEGLTVIQKFSAQVLTGLFAYFFMAFPEGHANVVNFGFSIHLGVILYPAFLILWLVGWSNAVNFTDGIDGLASISVFISLAAYAVIAYVQGASDLLMINLSVMGGLLAFYIFNRKPAKIFMGDVGSLPLGAFLGINAMLLRVEWTLILIGIVYVVEVLSVMTQVSYFRLTKGKRLFRMAPIHHHFELGGLNGKSEGWSEWRIDLTFWFVTFAGSTFALILYLLRRIGG